jgi:molybdopterin-biosynthesis enzyme MoeA-like protein
VCSDEVHDIAASVGRFLHDVPVDYVVTSGGLGPTHDDRTMEGLAAAIERPLVLAPEWEQWMRERVAFGHRLGYFQSADPNAGMLKMAHLPRDATAMPNHRGTALGAIVEADGRTLFTLPGVPSEFRLMFDESVVPWLEPSARVHVEELVLWTEESRFYETLVALDRKYPTVALGSYPQHGHIVIRASGPADDAKALIRDMRAAGAEYLERPDPPAHGDTRRSRSGT